MSTNSFKTVSQSNKPPFVDLINQVFNKHIKNPNKIADTSKRENLKKKKTGQVRDGLAKGIRPYHRILSKWALFKNKKKLKKKEKVAHTFLCCFRSRFKKGFFNFSILGVVQDYRHNALTMHR